MRRLALCLLVLPALALRAQGPDAAMRAADWSRAKATVLAYIDAAPDSMMTFRPTPGVRTFAEQIEHIVVTHYEVAAMVLRGVKTPPALGDSARYLHSKAALREVSARAFDYALAAVREAAPATWTASSAIYGQPASPNWKWIDMSLEHGTWTLGQVIPYLRLNKVTPPAYQIPF